MKERLPEGHRYGRISDTAQRKGLGLARQASLDAQAFCQLYGFQLAKRVWIDDGVSAFRGLHATPEHELGQFLLAAKRGDVHPGDCLLIENWDRLSRQNIWAAIGLVNDLRQLGIHVGRLDRMKLLRCDSDDPGEFFEAAVELMRGNSESTAKSSRQRWNWEHWREAARESGGMLPGMKPAWLEVKEGKFCVISERAHAVRLMFRWSAAGYGTFRIVQLLNEEGIVPFGPSGKWSRAYVSLILKDRRALGEFQPHDQDGKTAGSLLSGYFPAIITQEEWLASRTGMIERRTKVGRVSKRLNVFAGLLQNAIDGESYFLASNCGRARKGSDRPLSPVLRNTAGHDGRAATVSFPFLDFERAMFACLGEIDPREILGSEGEGNEVDALETQLKTIEAELVEANAFMSERGFSQSIGARIVQLEGMLADVRQRYELACEKAAHPLSQSWRDARSLLEGLDAAADQEQARLRLRSAIRRIIAGAWLVIVPRGRTRLAGVQVRFNGEGRVRNYVILSRPEFSGAVRPQPPLLLVGSLSKAVSADQLDLRKHAHAVDLHALLSTVPLSDLEARLSQLQA